jgi:hypothetical protein
MAIRGLAARGTLMRPPFPRLYSTVPQRHSYCYSYNTTQRSARSVTVLRYAVLIGRLPFFFLGGGGARTPPRWGLAYHIIEAYKAAEKRPTDHARARGRGRLVYYLYGSRAVTLLWYCSCTVGCIIEALYSMNRQKRLGD